MKKTKTITIHPSMFICPPYIKCPKCGKKSFGVTVIGSHKYLRRCKGCLYPTLQNGESLVSYPLPDLNKKVVYVDQLVLSNMMKALNPDIRARKRGAVGEFWLRLYERLDTLCRAQLIVCPKSEFHTNESLVSPFNEALKRMSEQLSCGVTFYDAGTIRRFQLSRHARKWIMGKGETQIELDVHSVTHGEINAWQGKLIISLNLNYGQDMIAELRAVRARTHEGINRVFHRWQTEQGRTFDDWFQEEALGFSTATLRLLFGHMKAVKDQLEGRAPYTANISFPPSEVELVHSIQYIFKQSGIQDIDLWPKTLECLLSPLVRNVPCVKIGAMLWAAIARKVAGGKKEPPTKGMANDINMLSVLLPYCDAMFVDKECHTYLREEPLRKAIDYGTQIFSSINKEEFLEYLNKIETNAPEGHLDKVEEVYGETWREPYLTLYEKASPSS